jgi:hypothetical protein
MRPSVSSRAVAQNSAIFHTLRKAHSRAFFLDQVARYHTDKRAVKVFCLAFHNTSETGLKISGTGCHHEGLKWSSAG